MTPDNKTGTISPGIPVQEINGSTICDFAFVNGLKMYYEIHGTGLMPLVLIHGGGSTIETSFGNILPLLATRYKVIAVELQAHGRTSDRDAAVSFEQDADDVVALLSYLKINRANLLGFSNGGNTVMQIAIRHPRVVNKLIIASSFYKRDGLIQGFFDGMQQATLDNMPALLKTGYFEVGGNENGLAAMFNKDRQRMLQFQDWADEIIRSIQAPTLLISGDNDVVTPEHAVEMLRTFPHAQLAILPGEHGAYIGEVTVVKEGSKIVELTVAMIDEFLINGE